MSFGAKFPIWNTFCPVTSAFQWGACQTMIPCPPARFPTCTLSWDCLNCLVLDHQFDNEGQALSWSLRLLRRPFLTNSLARIWSAEKNRYLCCLRLAVPFSPATVRPGHSHWWPVSTLRGTLLVYAIQHKSQTRFKSEHQGLFQYGPSFGRQVWRRTDHASWPQEWGARTCIVRWLSVCTFCVQVLGRI